MLLLGRLAPTLALGGALGLLALALRGELGLLALALRGNGLTPGLGLRARLRDPLLRRERGLVAGERSARQRMKSMQRSAAPGIVRATNRAAHVSAEATWGFQGLIPVAACDELLTHIPAVKDDPAIAILMGRA